jgi:pimeloyl-ACP methyl ester carboxylesterase
MEEIATPAGTLRYRLAGRGPLVVALHASSSHSGQWKALTAALADRFTVAAPDFLGYGRSDPLPADRQPYFVHDGAAVAALVARHGGRAHLVGHSLGGTLALRLAATRPGLALSLTAIEPVQFNLLAEAGDPRLAEPDGVAAAVAALMHYGRNREAARAFVDFWTRPGGFEAMDPATQGYVEATVGRVADDWAGVSAWAPGQLPLGAFRGLALPVLLLEGGATRASASAVVRLLAAAIPGARHEVVPGAGHMAAATDPAAIVAAIAGFLDGLPR